MAESQELTWGCAAVATAGGISVDVDEALDRDIWQITIDAPFLYLHVRIKHRDQIRQFYEFLKGVRGVPGLRRFELCCGGQVSLSVLRDDEFADRYFLALRGTDQESLQALRVTFSQPDADHLVAALGDVLEQLKD